MLRIICLLILSNCFMTTAWYGHLRYRHATMIAAILLSWLIALPEYCLTIPANRLGNITEGGMLTTTQLKLMQEAISLPIFLAFSMFILKERSRWQDIAGLGLVMAGLSLAFFTRPIPPRAAATPPAASAGTDAAGTTGVTPGASQPHP